MKVDNDCQPPAEVVTTFTWKLKKAGNLDEISYDEILTMIDISEKSSLKIEELREMVRHSQQLP